MSSKRSFLTASFVKCKKFFTKLLPSPQVNLDGNRTDIAARIERLERNYIILLKRVLEIDGVQLMSNKHSSFTSKVMATPADEFTQGLNEPEPTIH